MIRAVGVSSVVDGSCGVATVTINRADVNNAYNGDMIQQMLQAFGAIAAEAELSR